jgi:hypothetical protein
MTNETDHVINWIKEHDLINIRGLEKKAGVPIRTIFFALNNYHRLPAKHLPAIYTEIEKYGYKRRKTIFYSESF